MRIVYTFVLYLTVIFNSIECLPVRDPISDDSRPLTSNSSARPHSPVRPPSSAEILLRARSRPPPIRFAPVRPLPVRSSSVRSPHVRFSPVRPPPVRHSSLLILGFELEDRGLIRLIPHINPHRRFKIQRFIFPADKPIRLRGAGRHFGPMPTQERNVLTTSTDVVVAIMENNTFLRGIYNLDGTRRMGISMSNGTVFELSPELANETPLGTRHLITKNFRIINVNDILPHN
ncbi:uncharacterized protein LOC117175421 [Belonocnema kinseyi]|uniref:uncharacterized protein LOC117175421 n=1 Tax=Belonocnema kinseyi TaxID=2817044 RepID=UPI00143D87CD|nr:uncharacterized protein LOC117175421 [Belonocnema kinseyi]